MNSQEGRSTNYTHAGREIGALFGFEACLKFEMAAQSLSSCFEADVFSSAQSACSNAISRTDGEPPNRFVTELAVGVPDHK